MDHRRTFAALLTLAAVSAAPPLPIREANWIAPDRRFTVLSTEPGECFVQPKDMAEAGKAFIGRVAFRAPLLLGGQGARAGLSCASCHRNGRGNAHFIFPGLSGAPGTADVTASLMSSHRGDGAFNPKPIPDLGSDTPKVAHADLREFIRGLIVEEFDGPQPPAAILDGLVAYVRALDPKACKPSGSVTMAGTLEQAGEAAEAAMFALQEGDPATARVMLGSARSTLGRVDERLAGPRLSRGRKLVRELDSKLLQIQLAIDGNRDEVFEAIDSWLIAFSATGVTVAAFEDDSLFNADRLKAALAR